MSMFKSITLAAALLALPALALPNLAQADDGAMSQSDKDALFRELSSIELEAWEAWKSGDKKTYETLIDEPAVLINGTGVFAGKQSFLDVDITEGCEGREYDIGDMELHPVTATTAVLTFAAIFSQTCDNTRTDNSIIVSSLYAKRADGWKNVLYTESVAQEDFGTFSGAILE